MFPALSLTLYSIVLIPSLEKLMKEGGEASRTRVNRYTKILALVLALVEALGIYISYSSSSSNVFKK